MWVPLVYMNTPLNKLANMNRVFARCRPIPLLSLLKQTTVFKVLFDDDIRHGVEHDLNVLRICGTGQVGVDFFLTLLHVEIQELCLDVVAGIIIRVGA